MVTMNLLLILSVLALTTNALDVEVTDYECDSRLAITADFAVRCDGSKKCTFGQSTATISGVGKKNYLAVAGSF